MILILLFAFSYSHRLANNKNDESVEPTDVPTQSPYATLISKKPTLAIALSSCIACIVFMIIATSIKCILKSPDEQLDGMHEKLLITRNDDVA